MAACDVCLHCLTTDGLSRSVTHTSLEAGAYEVETCHVCASCRKTHEDGVRRTVAFRLEHPDSLKVFIALLA